MNEIITANNQVLSYELFNRFITFIDGSQRTVEAYKKNINQFNKFLHDNNITEPTRQDILFYRDNLKTYLKASTVQAYIVAVRQFFKWTDQEGIYKNIAENIKGAKIDREHKKDALTSKQMKDIFKSIKTKNITGKRDYAIIALTVTGGLRTIELQRANIEDIRTLADNTVLYIQGKGREEKTEYIKLTAPVEKAIRSYLNARGETNSKAPLFTSVSDRNTGGRLTTKSLSRIIKNVFIKAGYDSDRLTAHSLRHTAGTLNLLNGGTLEETQQLLRHSNINTTMIYLHHIERANNKSEERITNAIF